MSVYKYRLNKINFKSGTTVNLNNLTVIVGPNNCGKSRILKDINALTTRRENSSLVVASVEYELPNSLEELENSYKISIFTQNSQVYLRTLLPTLTGSHNVRVGSEWRNTVENILSKGMDRDLKIFAEWFGPFFVALLETEDRLKLIKECESSDIRAETGTLLQAFYKEGEPAEKLLRTTLKNTFGLDIRLDYASLRRLILRVGDDLSAIPSDLREAISVYETFEKIDDQGDGLRSFVATLLAILVGKRPVLLLDEPEAFLHPPQAFRLGELIAEYASSDRQIIVATHSSDLLRGIINKQNQATLIRITREGTDNRIHLLDATELIEITRDPLLSSTRVLEGLFYKGVVVVEADSDSVFYSRVSRDVKVSDEVHYAHAHNKQTVVKFIKPYRSLGVRHAVVIDFDILRIRDEFRALLEGMDVDQESINYILARRDEIANEIEKMSYEDIRSQLITSLGEVVDKLQNAENPENAIKFARADLKRLRDDSTTWSQAKALGRGSLSESGLVRFDEVDCRCRQKGIFIVPVGELESWLVEYGIARNSNKSKWIVHALTELPKLTMNPNKSVWAFISAIHQFLLQVPVDKYVKSEIDDSDVKETASI